MEKNVAGKWMVFAYGLPSHASPGEPVTGDAANITANIRIDGGVAAAVGDTNPTELEDGYYIFDITAGESDGDHLSIFPASSTSNVQVIGVPGALWTRPADFNDLTQNNIADAMLNRDMSAVSDTTARSPLNALRFLRNRWSVSGTTLTVYKEDDSTSGWTATLTTDSGADPVTGNDPA